MNKSRDLSLLSSMKATIKLSITEKNGAVRNRTVAMTTKSFPGGLEKRFIRFVEPADVRGTSMLVIDHKDKADEMWIYLPALKKTRRIVSRDKGKSFMSSEFSNADMSSPTLSDFTHRHSANSGNANTWLIESIPKNEDIASEYGYSKKISHICMEKFHVQKMEFYNFDNELFKIIETKDIQSFRDGKYMIKNMIASNRITGRKSEILFSNIDDRVSVEDSFFSVQNLER
ncbi:MAG: outer membrane lipoprotein-sorting protein [Bacteroidales bacterium]|jgi:hypothetical protein|nr:outer membrane lipoprotein-sorting protein [Bacteroidales bacterium]